MITVWTLLIILAVAYANAYVGIIGIRRRTRQGMRLWANDRGYYLPGYLAHSGFYRGLFINVGFAGTLLAVTGVSLPGDSDVLSRELLVVLGIVNFVSGLVVACLIPSDFDEVLVWFRGRFWRVASCGLCSLLIYAVTGWAVCLYVASLPKQ